MNNENAKLKSIEEALSEDGFAMHNVVGCSMLPLLNSKTDRVLLISPRALRVGDIALYKRGSDYVLHRIIEIKKQGEKLYKMRGDNCGFADALLKESEIIAVLNGFWRGDKYIEDLRLQRTHPLFILKVRDCLKKILKRL